MALGGNIYSIQDEGHKFKESNLFMFEPTKAQHNIKRNPFP